MLTFITPNKYLSAKYGSAFRDFINNTARISQYELFLWSKF
ncbi:MAG: hypothetical protein HS132_10015 [Planctomycetia bacterium]|nr:hypothetical protein [Planctomycetia bacterium]